MSPSPSLAEQIKAEGRRLGFDRAGITPAQAPPGLARFDAWLAAGYAGEMHYLGGRREAYAHPQGILAGAKSLVVLAHGYRNADPPPPAAGVGRVARYAWGGDYHDVLWSKINLLSDFVRALAPGANARGVVDTAPIAEREFAQLAGLGWIGKHTLLLNREQGSWFFLAVLLVDIELDYDEPFATDHCGTCTACLDACPTEAFPQPYVLDATRCISYLTIELDKPVPTELRPGVGDWLFGCDICQDVCPWNRKAPVHPEPAFQPSADLSPAELCGLFELDDAAFRARFRHSPLWRARRRGLLRNAAIVLGNQRQPAAAAALVRGLADCEPLIRGACVWALGQIATPESRAALAAHLSVEQDNEVLAELTAVLAPGAGRDGFPQRASRYNA